MIVASHDRYLVERVCDTRSRLFGDGRLTDLPGGVDEYLRRRAELDGLAIAASTPTAPAPTVDGGLSAAQVREGRKELARLERAIAKTERQEAQLHADLAHHATDHVKVAELDAELEGGASRTGRARGDLVGAGGIPRSRLTT